MGRVSAGESQDISAYNSPTLMTTQFQDSDFASLSGARIVRIATHPDYARVGHVLIFKQLLY
jgi:hypothetical protein